MWHDHKEGTFSLPHFVTNSLPFSLLFFPGSYPNILATCSSYSPRNVARYRTNVTLWFPHLNTNTTVVLCSGWRRENEHTKVSIAAWKVTLPLCREQSLDKEMDIKGLESNAHVTPQTRYLNLWPWSTC